MRTRTYRRARTRGRRGRRRSRGARRGAMAKRVTKLEDTAEETKHIIFSDQGIVGSNAMFAGAALQYGAPLQVYLNPLTRGTTVQNRIGDKAVITRIRIKLNFYFSSAVSDQCMIWWAIYKVKSGAAGSTTAANFLIGKYGVQPGPNTLPDINNRYQPVLPIIARGAYKHVAPVDATTEFQVINVNCFKKVYSEYRLGNAGTVSDMNKDALYLVVWTDRSPAGITVYGEGHVFFHG